VALAEQTGLVSRLSRTVLACALGECRIWHEAGHDISVAVNLAVSDLLDTTLPDTVAGLLAAHGLGPESLVLEITEDAIMVDPDRSRPPFPWPVPLVCRLVAEGVETLADWDYLRRLGVEVAQGYAISRPKCAPHFSAWLAGCS
jgi:EAL domain-containing protein (putative c-di-GMP-specific phosphodiesterase class I)